MGYAFETSGRVLLPEAVEHRPLTPGGPTLEELGSEAGVRTVRDGDWLLLVTDRNTEPTWSPASARFFALLSRWVAEGEVRLRGEDGATWSYRYSPEGLTQDGVSPEPVVAPLQDEATRPLIAPSRVPPKDGASLPAQMQSPAVPYPTEAEAPPLPQHTPPPSSPRWAPAPHRHPSTSSMRTLGMTLLLFFGVFLIVGVALLASGF